MATERLYYDDSYLTTFSAHVVNRRTESGHIMIALDRTAFYPEGGGQPADRGRLAGIAVLDVQVDAEGAIWHTLAEPVGSEEVTGEIDWPRRLDHMQQHHGQHILSAAFEDLFGLKTISFHLGAESSTIDLSGPLVGATQLDAAEGLANTLIWEDRPVFARFVDLTELATIRLRKPPTVTGPVRVVSVTEFDHSACGGTHPRATGMVGLLHIRRHEKRGTDTRVEFVCGARALRDLRNKHALLVRVAAQASVGLDELEEAVARLRSGEASLRKQLDQAVAELDQYEAVRLAAEAERVRDIPVVRLVLEGRTVAQVQSLARAIVGQEAIAILGLRGEKAHLLLARPPRVECDCGKLVSEVTKEFGGRGGGQPGMAQGGIPKPGDMEAAIERAAGRIRAHLESPGAP